MEGTEKLASLKSSVRPESQPAAGKGQKAEEAESREWKSRSSLNN